jgi:hypothetical protein
MAARRASRRGLAGGPEHHQAAYRVDLADAQKLLSRARRARSCSARVDLALGAYATAQAGSEHAREGGVADAAAQRVEQAAKRLIRACVKP